MNLKTLGWNKYFEDKFKEISTEGLVPARVIREYRNRYVITAGDGDYDAEVTGKMQFNAGHRGELPAVGDWVAARTIPAEGKAIIVEIIPRLSAFSRKAAGKRTDEQVVAANVDTVFIVTGLDGEFNARRVERYLTIAWESGANPVLLLNKSDACDNIDEKIEEAGDAAIGLDIHPLSAHTGDGIDVLHRYLKEGNTVAFLGSSGVGKSSIINRLLGEERMAVGDQRRDGKGRHTTTHRELIVTPDSGVIIDTPGMREIQLWGDDSQGVSRAFEDINVLSKACKFRDCTHTSEPGCAVIAALEDGSLDEKRYENYTKLLKEQEFIERRKDQNAQLKEKARMKKFTRQIKSMKNMEPWRFRK
ncbi:MAG: ribosome small subunit-dependent GTPase A [candidate division Zixibacteria bacterium]|nr:ribosome small subunit-dependent GTPase A [candidate division Zixibacteria bacterium]